MNSLSKPASTTNRLAFCAMSVGLLSLLTLAVFGQAVRFEFLDFDDTRYVTQHVRTVHGLTWDNFIWAFTTLDAEFWHPLTWLSLMLDWSLSGTLGKGLGFTRAGWYHLTNVLIHTGSVLLLFLTVLQATNKPVRSLLVAALFAVHPLRVESVVWVSERKDVLSTFFGILAVLAYFRFVSSRMARWYWVAFLAFLLSLMAKPTMVTLPFLLLVVDYWPLCRYEDFRRSKVIALVREKTPFIALTLLMCGLTVVAHKLGGGLQSLESFPVWARVANAVAVYGIYLRKMLWPNDLVPYYQHPGVNISAIEVVGSLAVLIAMTWIAWIGRRRCPYFLAGWLWYLGTLVPMIGLLQIWDFRMSDRFTYFPCIGLLMAVVWTLPALVPKSDLQRSILVATSALLVGMFALLAAVQTARWTDSRTLFRHTISASEKNKWAYNSLGTTLYNQGNIEPAIRRFEQVLALSGSYPAAHNNLALALSAQDKFDEAYKHFELAIQLRPNYAEAYHNYGVALSRNNRIPEAMAALQRAVEIRPGDYLAHFNLALMQFSMNNRQRAMYHVEQSLQARPEFEPAQKLLQYMRQPGQPTP